MKLAVLVFLLLLASSALAYTRGFVRGHELSQAATVQEFFEYCEYGTRFETQHGSFYCGKAKKL